MPKTISVTVYTFKELSPQAKERARAWYRDGAFDHDWWDSIYEDAGQIAPFLGITIGQRAYKTVGGKDGHETAIYFSGFSSQGDGACFEGSWRAADVKPFKELKSYAPTDKELHRLSNAFGDFAKRYPTASFTVKQQGHYSHEYCTDFTVEFADDPPETMAYDSPEYNARISELASAEKEVIGLARDFMKWIYRQLEAEYDYQNADEQVDDNIIANDYLFTVDGKRCARL